MGPSILCPLVMALATVDGILSWCNGPERSFPSIRMHCDPPTMTSLSRCQSLRKKPRISSSTIFSLTGAGIRKGGGTLPYKLLKITFEHFDFLRYLLLFRHNDFQFKHFGHCLSSSLGADGPESLRHSRRRQRLCPQVPGQVNQGPLIHPQNEVNRPTLKHHCFNTGVKFVFPGLNTSRR